MRAAGFYGPQVSTHSARGVHYDITFPRPMEPSSTRRKGSGAGAMALVGAMLCGALISAALLPGGRLVVAAPLPPGAEPRPGEHGEPDGGAPPVASTRPVPDALGPVEYTFRGDLAQLERRIFIAPDGAIRSVEKRGTGTPEVATGQLTDAHTAELRRAIRGLEGLPDSLPGSPVDRWQQFRIDGRMIERQGDSRSGAFAEAAALVFHLANQQCSPDVPAATSADLRVGVNIMGPPPGSPEGADADVVAYLLNKSDRAVRVYLPGLVGPNVGGSKDDPRTCPVLEGRVNPQFGPGDFVVLRPGELIGRRRSVGPRPGDFALGVYYTVYEVGQEGRQDAIVEVLLPDGRVSRRSK